ncbi:MAG: GDP-L-fucose synthase [Desulfuromonadaceae bacterium]|nr:GDP-L-fucose synthase [Desulfuromonadaceae bacterium]
MNKRAKIFVAGHRGLVGSAIVRRLQREGYVNLVLPTYEELDLREQKKVREFFSVERPDHVFLAAARVGGILANSSRPAEFIYDNLMIQSNVIHAAWQSQVKRLLFLGSSCIYPKFAPQPMQESHLLTGQLEPTNEPYAIAKISGIILCRSYNRQYGTRYLSIMPTNLYGQNDNFSLESSHVLPALIRKFHEAKVSHSPHVTLWGSGAPKRELLHVDDMADASVFLMKLDEERFSSILSSSCEGLLNIGTGTEVTIGELAELVREIVGFKGEMIFDSGKPDGSPRKLLDVSQMKKLGWEAGIGLREGIDRTYRWFLDNLQNLRM